MYCLINIVTFQAGCAIIRSMNRPASPLGVSEDQMRTLQAWVAARNTRQKMVLRSRIILLAHEGVANRVIARRLHTSRPTVIRWRKRFAQAKDAAA